MGGGIHVGMPMYSTDQLRPGGSGLVKALKQQTDEIMYNSR